MIAIDNSMREFIHQLTNVQWEWLLATLILSGKLLKLWQTHNKPAQTKRATRYWKPAHGSEHRTLNPKP